MWTNAGTRHYQWDRQQQQIRCGGFFFTCTGWLTSRMLWSTRWQHIRQVCSFRRRWLMSSCSGKSNLRTIFLHQAYPVTLFGSRFPLSFDRLGSLRSTCWDLSLSSPRHRLYTLSTHGNEDSKCKTISFSRVSLFSLCSIVDWFPGHSTQYISPW